ncbi:MAG: MFS transporter [Lachnospiraceae bacterium]|nr:MFS transporter [Lachnospiraceae bacterium]
MRKRKLAVIATCILIGCFLATFLYRNRELRFLSPFKSSYFFESVSEVVEKNGNTYVIDQAKKTVVVLDGERKLVRKIDGGSEKADFFYAGRVCGDDYGNIYIADIIMGEQGNRIQKERIIKIGQGDRRVLYEFDDTKRSKPPLQYGEILELKIYRDDVYFVKSEGSYIDVYRILQQTEQVEKIESIPCPYFVSDATYDAANRTVLITTRLGEVFCCFPDSNSWSPVPAAFENQIPWKIVVADGEVYYTDLNAKGICHFSLSEPDKTELLHGNETVLYALGVSEDGRTITATDYENFFYLDSVSKAAEVCAEAAIGYRYRVILFWGLLAAIVIAVAGGLILLGIRVIKSIPDKSGFGRMILVVVSSVIVASIASYSSISVLLENHDRLVMDNMQVFAESLRQRIDVDALRQIESISDYHSADYMNIKNALDQVIEAGYAHNTYYYYVLYDTDGKTVNCLMDYEDTTVCGQPIYEYGDNEYTRVLQTGETYSVSEISSYGSWMFTLLPVRDTNGKVVAELEVGFSLDKAVQEKKDLVTGNIITVVCSCGVMIMLVLEGIFVLSFFEKRRKLSRDAWDITHQMPIRVMVFLVYMTDAMQDAFIAILCSRLYADTLPLPREVAIALPMSLQLMAAAVFSMCGGRFAEKYGIRRIMQMGLLGQMIGFLICLLVPGYTGILAGKLLIGMGLGTVYVTCNTMASLGGSSELVESGFADVSAGVLSGVTIGAGLGSIILSFSDYRIVYLAGALFMAGGLVLTIPAKNLRFVGSQETETDKKKFPIVKFLLNRRVIAFFLLILVPFMMSLSYREYFFPLYVEQYGMDEVQIGRIYLVCGMFVIYIGPMLSKYVLRVLGAKKSIVLASLCMAFDMALFVLFPNIVSVLIGMVILAVVISFAYTCQYTYFEGLEECEQAGMGNAMGIYAMFENIGQTLGPIVYGAALTLGNRHGIFLLFVLMFILIGLFLQFGQKKKREYK